MSNIAKSPGRPKLAANCFALLALVLKFQLLPIISITHTIQVIWFNKTGSFASSSTRSTLSIHQTLKVFTSFTLSAQRRAYAFLSKSQILRDIGWYQEGIFILTGMFLLSLGTHTNDANSHGSDAVVILQLARPSNIFITCPSAHDGGVTVTGAAFLLFK
ncbi:hypothetical protein GW750_03430 [bacterium]|nr:hypothetical protein [bacterium]